MEEEATKLLEEQTKILETFTHSLQTSNNIETIQSEFDKFLRKDGDLQEFLLNLIEHQKICKDIENLEESLSIVNNKIKKYSNKLNKIDKMEHKLLDKNKVFLNPFNEHIQPQKFNINDLLKLSYKLRNNCAIQQPKCNLQQDIIKKNWNKPPAPQIGVITKSILRYSIDELKNEFLSNIVDQNEDNNLDNISDTIPAFNTDNNNDTTNQINTDISDNTTQNNNSNINSTSNNATNNNNADTKPSGSNIKNKNADKMDSDDDSDMDSANEYDLTDFFG